MFFQSMGLLDKKSVAADGIRYGVFVRYHIAKIVLNAVSVLHLMENFSTRDVLLVLQLKLTNKRAVLSNVRLLHLIFQLHCIIA